MTEPTVEAIAFAADDAPIVLASTGAIPADEVNPDTLATMFGMTIRSLEGEAEDREVAMDWGTLVIGLLPHDSVTLVHASVRRLVS